MRDFKRLYIRFMRKPMFVPSDVKVKCSNNIRAGIREWVRSGTRCTRFLPIAAFQLIWK